MQFFLVHFWLTLILTIGVAVIGLLWAPVGCLICGVIAYRRGLDVRLWMGRGLVGSALLLFPWLYAFCAVSSVNEMGVPRYLQRTGYILAYSAWLAGPIGLMISIVTGSFVAQWQGVPDGFTDHPVFYTVAIAVTVASLCTWLISLRTSMRKLRGCDAEFDSSLYRPWVMVIAWLLAFLALMFIFGTIELQDSSYWSS